MEKSGRLVFVNRASSAPRGGDVEVHKRVVGKETSECRADCSEKKPTRSTKKRNKTEQVMILERTCEIEEYTSFSPKVMAQTCQPVQGAVVENVKSPEVIKLEKELQASQAACSLIKAHANQLERINSSLHDKLITATKPTRMTKEHKELRASHAKLQEEMQKVEQELQKMHSGAKTLQASIGRKERLFALKEEEILSLDLKLNETKQKLESKEQENKTLKEENGRLAKECKGLSANEAKMNTLKTTLQNTVSEKKKGETQISSLQTKMQAHEDKLSSLQTTLQEVLRERDSLKQKLEAKNKELEGVRKEMAKKEASHEREKSLEDKKKMETLQQLQEKFNSQVEDLTQIRKINKQIMQDMAKTQDDYEKLRGENVKLAANMKKPDSQGHETLVKLQSLQKEVNDLRLHNETYLDHLREHSECLQSAELLLGMCAKHEHIHGSRELAEELMTTRDLLRGQYTKYS